MHAVLRDTRTDQPNNVETTHATAEPRLTMRYKDFGNPVYSAEVIGLHNAIADLDASGSKVEAAARAVTGFRLVGIVLHPKTEENGRIIEWDRDLVYDLETGKAHILIAKNTPAGPAEHAVLYLEGTCPPGHYTQLLQDLTQHVEEIESDA